MKKRKEERVEPIVSVFQDEFLESSELVVEEKVEESFEEKIKVKPVGKFDLEKKVAAIEASDLPDSQKKEYLKSLGIGVVKESGVTFSVYAKVRKIEPSRHSAMLAFPKAKGIRLASLEKWDEIFKEF